MFGRRRVVRIAAVAVLAGFAASDADAATVAVDVGMKTLVPNGTTAEPTLGLRVGHELDLKIARFVPEVGIVGIPETSFFGGIAGGRFSFLRLIEPGVYAHLGYGGIVGETGGKDFVFAHVSADVEAEEDSLRVPPLLQPGAHNAANATDDNVSVIDTATNTAIDVIPAGSLPIAVAVSVIAEQPRRTPSAIAAQVIAVPKPRPRYAGTVTTPLISPTAP